jgi:hypothetical protein
MRAWAVNEVLWGEAEVIAMEARSKDDRSDPSTVERPVAEEADSVDFESLRRSSLRALRSTVGWERTRASASERVQLVVGLGGVGQQRQREEQGGSATGRWRCEKTTLLTEYKAGDKDGVVSAHGSGEVGHDKKVVWSASDSGAAPTIQWRRFFFALF